jgi:hypothetical protein
MPIKKEKDKKPKEKKEKEKKPRGRPRKVVKQTQTQKQVVIVNVGEKKPRGRPRKQPITEKLSLLPPTILRLNQPPVPFPQQPTMNVTRESVKPMGSESVLNTLQQNYQQDYDASQSERLASKLYESAMKKEGREEELYPNTPYREPLAENTPVSQGVMYPMAEAELARHRKERSDKGKPRGSYKSKDSPTITLLYDRVLATEAKKTGKKIIIGNPKQP